MSHREPGQLRERASAPEMEQPEDKENALDEKRGQEAIFDVKRGYFRPKKG